MCVLSLTAPVFEDDGFASEFSYSIKTQHRVTFLWSVRLWLHFPLVWVWACDWTYCVSALFTVIFPQQ